MVGAEVVGTDELSDGTSDADVEAPKTVPDVSEEGARGKMTGRYPDNEQKNRDAQFAPKNGQKPKPSRWPAYTSSAHRKGQKPSPAAGYFFQSQDLGRIDLRVHRAECVAGGRPPA